MPDPVGVDGKSLKGILPWVVSKSWKDAPFSVSRLLLLHIATSSPSGEDKTKHRGLSFSSAPETQE